MLSHHWLLGEAAPCLPCSLPLSTASRDLELSSPPDIVGRALLRLSFCFPCSCALRNRGWCIGLASPARATPRRRQPRTEAEQEEPASRGASKAGLSTRRSPSASGAARRPTRWSCSSGEARPSMAGATGAEVNRRLWLARRLFFPAVSGCGGRLLPCSPVDAASPAPTAPTEAGEGRHFGARARMHADSSSGRHFDARARMPVTHALECPRQSSYAVDGTRSEPQWEEQQRC
jgi:hypothetical protein